MYIYICIYLYIYIYNKNRNPEAHEGKKVFAHLCASLDWLRILSRTGHYAMNLIHCKSTGIQTYPDTLQWFWVVGIGELQPRWKAG